MHNNMIILDGGYCMTALRGRAMEANTAQLSDKKDCPPANEHYCLNGETCFIFSPRGQYDIKACA